MLIKAGEQRGRPDVDRSLEQNPRVEQRKTDHALEYMIMLAPGPAPSDPQAVRSDAGSWATRQSVGLPLSPPIRTHHSLRGVFGAFPPIPIADMIRPTGVRRLSICAIMFDSVKAR